MSRPPGISLRCLSYRARRLPPSVRCANSPRGPRGVLRGLFRGSRRHHSFSRPRVGADRPCFPPVVPGIDKVICTGSPQTGRKVTESASASLKRVTLELGGKAMDGPGYFVPVTILDNPPEDSRIVQEEPFGPILPLLKVEDIEEVVAKANASDYGLGASVWWGTRKRRLPRAPAWRPARAGRPAGIYQRAEHRGPQGLTKDSRDPVSGVPGMSWRAARMLPRAGGGGRCSGRAGAGYPNPSGVTGSRSSRGTWIRHRPRQPGSAAAGDDVVDVAGLETVAVGQRLQDLGQQALGVDFRQGAFARLADAARRAGRVDDPGFLQGHVPNADVTPIPPRHDGAFRCHGRDRGKPAPPARPRPRLRLGAARGA